MKLSVIIPSFNRHAVVGRAIDSVLAQTYLRGRDDWELILVDDGSTDQTHALVSERYLQTQPNVLYFRQDNLGVSAARNMGIRRANGEWIALLDSDDQWLPHKLAAQFALLESGQHQVCHSEEIWIRNGVRVNQMNKHKKSGGWIFERCLPLCAMSPSSIVIHKSVFEAVGLFDQSLPACEDYDLWLKIASQYPVAYIEQACINKYGGHDDQLSRQYWGMDRFRVIALENLLASGLVLSPSNHQAALKVLLKKLSILLKGAVKHGNHELAERCQQSLSKLSAEEHIGS
ncbi:MAG: glycosyltransferase involved in cell wall biosynthesis [Arenicella sp.]|jgi:glycosyltransferase involved in cell wall biosynthesis